MKGASSTSVVIVAVTMTIMAGFVNARVFPSGPGHWARENGFNGGEIVYTNFIKVLAGVMITIPEPPIPILQAVKTVMRETMNTQNENENFVQFLMTGMRGVQDKPLEDQMDSMLAFLSNLPKETQLANAAKILQSYLNSAGAVGVYEDVENYVTNLFQSVITTPMIDSSGESLSTLGRARPANANNNNLHNNTSFNLTTTVSTNTNVITNTAAPRRLKLMS